MSDKNETVMINLNLSLDQVNVIMQALGNAPYASVVTTIDEIRNQATAQLPQNQG